MDTYLFVNDLSTGAQDKIRRTFSDTPQKIEMPKKVSSTDGKKSKQSKSELNDEPERMNKSKEQTNLEVMEKVKENPKEPKEIVVKENKMPELEQVENQDETEKSKTFEMATDLKAETVLKETATDMKAETALKETATDIKAEPVLKEESKDSVSNIVTESTIPKTWQFKIHDGREVLVSPSGDLFPTRRLALKKMLESKESSKEELEEMRACLVHEGWMKGSKLPTGWMMKVVKGKEIILLSEGMKQFGMKAAISSMEKSGRFSKDIIDGLKEMQKSHQEEEDEAKKIKTEEVVMEKNEEAKAKDVEEKQKTEEVVIKKTNKSKIKEVKAEYDEDVKEEVKAKVKEKKVKEKKVKEDEIRKEGTGKLKENETMVSSNQDVKEEVKEGVVKEEEKGVNEEKKEVIGKLEEKKKANVKLEEKEEVGNLEEKEATRSLEEKKEVSLPPGWMFNLSGKVAKFTLFNKVCRVGRVLKVKKVLEIVWLTPLLQVARRDGKEFSTIRHALAAIIKNGAGEEEVSSNFFLQSQS